MGIKPRCCCPRVFGEDQNEPADCPVHPMPTLHWITGTDGTADARVWREWFNRHGIDRHHQIALNMPIIRNVEEHQIVVIELWQPEADRVDTDGHAAPSTFYRDSYKDVVYRARVIQLDREPDPFPYVRPRPQFDEYRPRIKAVI